jgi:hypothetical protein
MAQARSAMPGRRRLSLGLRRTALWAVIAAALAVGFVGYLHPDMQLDWLALAQMCGLR